MMFENPILFRERRAKLARNRRVAWWRRSGYGGMLAIWLVPLVIGFACNRGTDYWAVVCTCALVSVYLQVLYVCLRGLVLSAAAIARERDLQTWDTLLSTPMGVQRLVSGKYASVVLPLLTEVLVTSPFLLVLLFLPNEVRGWCGHYDGATLIFQIAWLNVISVLFFSAVGLLLSALSPTGARASARAAVAALIVFVGTWLMDVLIAALGHSDVGPFLSLLNPYVALNSFISGSMSSYAHGFSDPTLGMVTLGIYLLGAGALYRLTISRVARESAR